MCRQRLSVGPKTLLKAKLAQLEQRDTLKHAHAK